MTPGGRVRDDPAIFERQREARIAFSKCSTTFSSHLATCNSSRHRCTLSGSFSYVVHAGTSSAQPKHNDDSCSAGSMDLQATRHVDLCGKHNSCAVGLLC